MNFFTPKNPFPALLILAVAVSFAGCSPQSQTNEPIITAQESPAPRVKPCLTEPTYSIIPNDPDIANMKAAWERFVADGRYRLACDADADFALDAAEPKTINSYSRRLQSRSIANWGDWNYPKRLEEDHLAAIVVDTTRSDANRFGIVIFSPLRSEKTAYEINWLYRDRDLSRASVLMASGSVYVENFTADGQRISCFIKWNKSRRIFECK